MNGSRSIRVHFNALILICEEMDKQGETIPRPLARWRQEVAEGRRKPPAMKPIPAHRPPNQAQFARDMHIQFAIAVLGEGWRAAPRKSRLRLSYRGRGVEASGRYGSAHLESVHVENILRARDAEILGGHRQTHWVIPYTLRREPRPGSISLALSPGERLPLAVRVTTAPPPGRGWLDDGTPAAGCLTRAHRPLRRISNLPTY